jgi:IS30 family transposase
MGRRKPLRFKEREIISRELSRNPKCSSRFLGQVLGRHHSTIARKSTVTAARRITVLSMHRLAQRRMLDLNS